MNAVEAHRDVASARLGPQLIIDELAAARDDLGAAAQDLATLLATIPGRSNVAEPPGAQAGALQEHRFLPGVKALAGQIRSLSALVKERAAELNVLL